jgi:hypothetical protein
MPILFSFAVDADCSVASQFNGLTWEISLLQPLSMTAQTQLQTLMAELANTQLPHNNPIGKRLMINTGKQPTAKDFYRLFMDRGLIWEGYKWVWQNVIPLRHRFFVWLAFRGRLNTKDNMVNKTWCSDAGCDQCPALESIHHIGLHCKQATWVWEKLGQSQSAATASTINHFILVTDGLVKSKAWSVCAAACFHAL